VKADDRISGREERHQARQRAMSIARFSEGYGIGRTKAYEELKSGRLRGRKIGTRTLISEDDAEAWLQRLPALPVTKTTT
jgi:excisionase family DNA binding protein